MTSRDSKLVLTESCVMKLAYVNLWSFKFIYTLYKNSFNTSQKKSDSALRSGDTWWRSWLRQCATCRRVAGSIPDDVIVIFH